MTWISPAETRRQYKRTQERHQKPRPQPRGDTRRGDQPPPTKRSRAPNNARRARAERPAEPHEDGRTSHSGSRAAPAEHQPTTTPKEAHTMIDLNSRYYPREVYNRREDVTRENMRRYDANIKKWYDTAERLYSNFYKLKGAEKAAAAAEVDRAAGFTRGTF